MSTGNLARTSSLVTARSVPARDPAIGYLEGGLRTAYGLGTRLKWAILAMVLGIVIAGMWNYNVVDGFGKGIVASNLIGDSSKLAGSFAARGTGFGVIFAAVAGLAATFTACNCVVYAMLPGLACSTDKAASRKKALDALLIFAVGVVAVGAIYGLYVGTLGADGAKVLNQARLPQAQYTFTILGLAMVIWGALAFGFFHGIVAALPESTRAFFSQPRTHAGIMGVMVGLFAVGRPYPVFRDFLTYAATSHSPLYGALVMSIQGIGQIALMVALFLGMVFIFGNQLSRWVQNKPHQQQLVSTMALFAGGAYFIFYWGLALSLNIGSWGFKLGIYH